MKNILRGKKWTATAIGIVFLMLAGLVVLSVIYFQRLDYLAEVTVMLEGEYAVDDGAWQPIDNITPIRDRFHKVVFRGRIPEFAPDFFTDINISSKNVWYTLKAGDRVVAEHVYHSWEEQMDAEYQDYLAAFEDIPEEPVFDRAGFEKSFEDRRSISDLMPNTPGYFTDTLYFTDLSEAGVTPDTDLTLEVVNPYPAAELSFSEAFDVTYSAGNGAYLKFFFEALPTVLFFVLICFFGIFLFPIAGFILGRINYRYFTFGVLCFFWGLFMIGQKISGYLNLWISDYTVCMVIVIMLNYFFIITTLFYLKSNLERSVTRAIANVAATLFLILVVAAAALHFATVIDLNATAPYLSFYTLLCTIILTTLLIIEARNSRRAVILLISWTPLTLSLIADAADYFLHFTDIQFYSFGLAITMIYQMVRLVLDLRQQYREAIRYQQMQKELYEAKVGVMVSQIQPHFMYNALTSIAMMCTIDPETAQEATVTFAKYLRGNMDSLKQTKPIPFTQELEHLKKYLYIEKLRFGSKLNLVYDIQATDFVLPQLSVQPLVENAVKHGVGMKKKGGTVTIATRETETAFEVVISDDGVGFNTAAPPKDDGRSHVGMENTKKRLHDLCGGEVMIESTVGEGTVARVILPKKGQNHENTLP